MIWLGGIFRTLLGSAIGRITAIAVAGFIAIKLYGVTMETKGAAKVVARIEKKANADVAKAEKIRRAVQSGSGWMLDPNSRD